MIGPDLLVIYHSLFHYTESYKLTYVRDINVNLMFIEIPGKICEDVSCDY